jgi:hypothetical protein
LALFNLNWFNAAVLVNPNSVSQRVSYRQKSVGGVFSTTGFTPANDLPKTASSATSPVLAENKIWQFRVQCICTVGGPTSNDNGDIEGFKFICITPTLSQTTTTATITLNVLGLDITKARFTLHLESDDSVVSGPTVVNVAANSITYTATGLTPGTTYYWETELYTTLNGVEIISSDADQLNTSCMSIDFLTTEDICVPCTAITATAIEVA